MIGQSFHQFIGARSHEFFHFCADFGVTDRVSDIVAKIDKRIAWPDRQRNGQALRLTALGLADPDSGGKLELLDVDAISRRRESLHACSSCTEKEFRKIGNRTNCTARAERTQLTVLP